MYIIRNLAEHVPLAWQTYAPQSYRKQYAKYYRGKSEKGHASLQRSLVSFRVTRGKKREKEGKKKKGKKRKAKQITMQDQPSEAAEGLPRVAVRSPAVYQFAIQWK
jgi:hypothetical protein